MEAVTSLQKAVDLDAENATYHFNLGVVHEKLGDFDASVAHMQRTIALDPQHASALNYLGYMYAERGMHLDESIETIQRALAIEPNNGYFLDSLGWAFFKKGLV